MRYSRQPAESNPAKEDGMILLVAVVFLSALLLLSQASLHRIAVNELRVTQDFKLRASALQAAIHRTIANPSTQADQQSEFISRHIHFATIPFSEQSLGFFAHHSRIPALALPRWTALMEAASASRCHFSQPPTSSALRSCLRGAAPVVFVEGDLEIAASNLQPRSKAKLIASTGRTLIESLPQMRFLQEFVAVDAIEVKKLDCPERLPDTPLIIESPKVRLYSLTSTVRLASNAESCLESCRIIVHAQLGVVLADERGGKDRESRAPFLSPAHCRIETESELWTSRKAGSALTLLR